MKKSTITLTDIKDEGWYEVGIELGLESFEISKVFEYGEFGGLTVEIDENFNIIGGYIHKNVEIEKGKSLDVKKGDYIKCIETSYISEVYDFKGDGKAFEIFEDECGELYIINNYKEDFYLNLETHGKFFEKATEEDVKFYIENY